jgi:aspartate racemase
MKTMLDLIGAKKLPEVTDYITAEVKKLAEGGADFALLASNTPHIVFDDIQRNSAIPLISIVEAARDAARALKMKKVGLFGTRFTMQGGFYDRMFSEGGIGMILPDAEDQAFIHDKYMGELVNGLFLPETRDRLLAIVDKLRKRSGIEGLVLGGTELPLILNESEFHGIPFLDTTKIHAEKAVERMLM